MTEYPSGADRPQAAIAASTAIPSVRKGLRLSLLLLVALASLVLFAQFGSSAGAAAQQTHHLTVVARDFTTLNNLDSFNFIVNEDNTKLPTNPLALNTESFSAVKAIGNKAHDTVSLEPGRYLISVRAPDHKLWGEHITVGASDQTVTIDLTEASADHPLLLGKIRVFVFNDNAWTNGAPDTEEAGLNGFTAELTEQTGGEVTVDYNNHPLCGGVCVTGGSDEGADAGFVEINNLGPATYFIDVHAPDSCNPNNPTQPGSGHWFQTTTIDGGLSLLASVEEGADGTGAPGEQLWEPPNLRTAYWFGFVCSPRPFSNPGSGEITGTARNWVEWAPYTFGTLTDPVENPFVALSDAATDQTIYVGQGDAAGNFDIQGVPVGDYNLAIWDEQLTYIMRFKPVHVDAGQTVDVNETGDDGSVGVGVSRWFGWLDGYVYKDLNGNGKYDGPDAPIANTDVDQRWRDGSIKEGTITDNDGYYVYPTAEGGALGKWFINEQGFSRFSADPGASFHDEVTGAVTPSCFVAAPVTPCIPNAEGGGLLVNQSVLEGHRTTVDWGKHDYPAGTPGQIVGITYWATTRNEFIPANQAHEDYEPAVPDAVVLLETLGPDNTPNTDDDVVVNKYFTDHWAQPNASQDPQDPAGNSFTQNCSPITDFGGNNITAQFSAKIGPNCLEVPLDGAKTKDGKFDGGYAFTNYCPASAGGYDQDADDGSCNDGSSVDDHPLVAGDYITHELMAEAPGDPGYPIVTQDPNDTRSCNPAGANKRVSDAKPTGAGAESPSPVPGGGTGCLYRVVREEDVNVDLGQQFTEQIPPPPCIGDDHVIDGSTMTPRSTYHDGDVTPLCDKHLVTLENGQNANSDFNLMTNFITDPNGENASDHRIGDVEEPGRVAGQVFNDIYFERNQNSVWYGEPRPIRNIPIGIYARVDTKPNINCPDPAPEQKGIRCFDKNAWRLVKTLTTSADGSYEALLPSTETLNCPIPQGPCPGMYIAVVDDPGSKTHPNANYNPNVLTANTPFEVWPGLTTQLDTPVDPISGTACEDPVGAQGGTVDADASDPTRPELLEVSRPYVLSTESGAARRITIKGDFIGVAGPTGATGGRITLTDVRNPNEVTTLTRSNGGVVSWTQGPNTTSHADEIVIQVPALNTSNFRPGPKQLAIVTSNNNPGGGGVSSVNGITIHVLGSNGSGGSAVTYTPNVVNVAAPPPVGSNPHALQAEINAAAPGSLLVLSPGTYNENILLWKPLKIQGLGPGGIVGAHEFQGRDPEDPRFDVKGSLIDGRFFDENATDFDALVAAHPGIIHPPDVDGNPRAVLRGADITVVAESASAYNLGTGAAGGILSAARIDGLGLTTGRGDGAGGIQLQAQANNLQITNDVLENNGGVVTGGIGLGQPYVHASHNNNVRMANNRLIGNGGLTTSGGLGVFYGSDSYEVANSIICSNFSVEYGAGISHIGLSPNGSIHDNRIYYNDSVDSGAGIAIETELPNISPPPAVPTVANTIGNGSGAVTVEKNLIQSNFSGDDGGGIFVLDSLNALINIRNNMIVNNGAADMGGAVTLDDSANVQFVNNTVANNVSTDTSENSPLGVARSAGLASEQNDPLFQATLPAGSPDYSDPVALFNNIFWNNQAYTIDQFGPGAALTAGPIVDFQIRSAANDKIYTNARYNLFTNGNVLQADDQTNVNMPGGGAPVTGFPTVAANRGNIVGIDPQFITPFVNELTVSGSRLDPQQAAVTITGADPPVGLTGNYHLPTGVAAGLTSSAVDRGVHCSNAAVPPPTNGSQTVACTGTPVGIAAPAGANADIDGNTRPQIRSTRLRTRWDLGADEVSGLPSF